MKNKIIFKNRFTTICAFMCMVLIFGLSGCAGNQTKTPEASEAPVLLANTVIAEGHLEPITSTWLSFQTTGRVEAVLVQEGDEVKQGQPLVRLEGSDRAESELAAAQSALFLAEQNLNDTRNSDALRGAAELELATAQREYNRALYNYNSRVDPQGSAEQISLYKARVIIAQDKVDELQEDLNGMAETSDDDVLKNQIIAKLSQAQMELDDTKDNYNYYKDLPDDIDVDRLTAELDIVTARVEDAQRDLDRLKDGPSKESLAALQAAADQAQASVDNAQWAYDQLVLKAPYNGVFVQCDLTVGEFVTVGQRVALVADFSKWQIESDDLDEIEINQIDASKPVSITADAIPDQEYTGEVDQISQYYTDDNGDILYTARVRLDKKDDLLRWGMTMQMEFEKKE